MRKTAYRHPALHGSFAILALSAVLATSSSRPALAFDALSSALSDISHPYAAALTMTTPAISTDTDREELFKVSTANVGAGAENFIDNMAKRALDFLGNPATSQDQKTASFRKLLNDSFDLETISRFVLGRYWKTSTDQQRNEYQALFRAMVVDVYAKRFGDYKGQKFETRGNRADGEKDTIVTSFIVPIEGPEVQVDWRVRYKNGRYQIVDVIVEGVSMSVTQRSEFAAVIQRGGGDMQVLLAHLRGK
ncbi:MAG: ABC transporter substrate-binding protein [Alphaproteobacteria bacterium]|nr:ABC transporter substrate-binding protein [Alphaproteobacteria bacterium]